MKPGSAWMNFQLNIADYISTNKQQAA